MPTQKANLNTPPKKKPSGSGSGSGSGGGTGSNTGSPLKQSVGVDTNRSYIVRPALAATTHKAAMKVYHNVDNIRSMGLSAGDTVLIGKRGELGVVGVITPATNQVREDTIEIPKALRKVGGLLLGDRVIVTKQNRPENALKVVIGTASFENIEEMKKDVLKIVNEMGMVTPGIEFTVNEQKMVIIDVEGMPKMDKLSLDGKTGSDKYISPVFNIDSKTELEFTSDKKIKNNSVRLTCGGYESIGGLSKVIESLKSAIELPLHHPNLFKRFNSSPERGFLLHGPPGTGKTTLLRAVAQESDAHVLTINGPSIVSKYLGETEEALRKIFEEARDYQPAIIFIDEIDSLVPKRDSDDSGEAESRVVSTMLTLMDNGSSGGQICVIGATNRPNKIDPALRRPGRFGTEFEIGIPDVEARLEILRLELKDRPHQLTDEFIQNLASRTHGYVGSDLYGLRRDAVRRAIQRGRDSDADDNEMFITVDDMEQAMIDIRPSAMREVVLETPKVYWNDIGGQEVVKQALHEAIELPITKPEAFKRLGIQPPRGILLYGPPGCSKTLIAKALATETGLNFLAVKGPEIFNKYVGESERAIREVFRKARAAAPSVVFFDEIDALSAARGGGHGEAGGDRVLTSLLNEMDGIEQLKDVTILAATNIPDTIDPALMRPGRLDRKVYVPPPDIGARQKIFEIQFNKIPVGEDVDIAELVGRTEGCSGAEVVSLCQEAGMLALQESYEIENVCKRHFDGALGKLQKAITSDILEYFEEFKKRGIS